MVSDVRKRAESTEKKSFLVFRLWSNAAFIGQRRETSTILSHYQRSIQVCLWETFGYGG